MIVRRRDSDEIAELDGLGLPDDLPEVALADQPTPDAATVARIKERTLRLMQADGSPSKAPLTNDLPRAPTVRRRAPRWAVATAAAALFVVLVLTIPPVSAAVRQLLSFVPGFGIREAAIVRLAAADTVQLERDGITVVVRGLLADDRSTVAAITVDGQIPLALEGPYLEDAAGRRYVSAGGHSVSSSGSGRGFMQVWLSFQPTLPADTRQVTLVLPGAPDWRLTVPLVPAADLTALEQFGPTDTATGVTIAARAEQAGDRIDVGLLVQGLPSGTRLTSLGRLNTGIPGARVAELLTDDSRRFPLRSTYSSYGELRELAADGASGSHAKVVIPLLSLSKQVRAKVRVPIPTLGSSLALQLPFKVDRWTATVTRVEACEEAPGNPILKVWVDPGPIEAYTLTNLSGLQVNGQPSSSSAEVDPETGRILWFAVSLPRGRSATVGFTSIDAELIGPWVIDLPVGP